MKKIVLVLCLMFVLLSTTAFTTGKAKANAIADNAYNSLYGSYDWWYFLPPSSNTYGTQIGDKIYWQNIDLASLHMYPSSYSENNTLYSGSTLNWVETNIYVDVHYEAVNNNIYYHKSFVLRKDGEVYYLKNYSSVSDRTSLLLYSGNLPEGNYSFTYIGAYSLYPAAAITFTYKFDFVIHQHNYKNKTTPPTCTENGYTRHICSDCGDYYDTDIIYALGHKFISTSIPATCTEDGGVKHTCSVCGYEYITDIVFPMGHMDDSYIVKEADCTHEGERYYVCEHCGEDYSEIIPASGHNYIISDVVKEGKITKRVWTCTRCSDSYIENLGNQYEKVASYVELLFNKYSPYMIWVFLGTAGVWSIFIGISYIIAQKNDEKEKAKRMLVNYAIGMVAIFFILVACPYLIRGITALVT